METPIVRYEGSGVSAFPEWVRDMAFGQYILADRRAAGAHRRLVTIWDEEWGDAPDIKTVQRWARIHNWDYRADVLVAEQYPALYLRDLARLIALRSVAISTYAALMEGTFEGSNPMAAAQVAKHAIDMTVSGMSVQAPRAEVEGEEKTPEQAIAQQRERLERGRGKS